MRIVFGLGLVIARHGLSRASLQEAAADLAGHVANTARLVRHEDGRGLGGSADLLDGVEVLRDEHQVHDRLRVDALHLRETEAEAAAVDCESKD